MATILSSNHIRDASITALRLSPELMARLEGLEKDRAVLLALVQELANRSGVKIDAVKEFEDIGKRLDIANRLQGVAK
jgi:hypothetical protein